MSDYKYIEKLFNLLSDPLYNSSHEGVAEIIDHTFEKIFSNNLDKKDTEGLTLLMHAVIHSNKFMVEYLLKKGVNVNEIDNEGWSAIFYAVCFSCNKMEMIKLLLSDDSNINMQDENGCTPLMYATKLDDDPFEIIEFMSLQSDLSIVDKNGLNALDYAIRYSNYKKIVSHLKELYDDQELKYSTNDNEIKRNKINSQNRIHDRSEIVEGILSDSIDLLSLEEGSDNEEESIINKRDKKGRTALMIAIRFNNVELIKILLKKKVNLDIIDKSGRTILDFIAESKNKEIIDLFSKFIDSKRETIFMKLARNIKDKETLELFF
jgi:ankyrin repeat protein